MVYPKTFTTFARHAFQKAAFTGHAGTSPSGAAHASSFFNQSFAAGAGRSQLGHGAIANRFQTQFGAHAGKNNPSQGNGQTLYGQLQNSMAASTTNDDGSKEQDGLYRPVLSLTRRFQNTVFAPISDADLPQSGARQYSTAVPQPTLSADILSEEDSYSNLHAIPNLPESSPGYVTPTLESYEKEVTNFMEKGDFRSVISVYHDMKRQGFVPTARLYNQIIVSLSRTRAQEPVNSIVEVYTEMLERQIEPEISTVSTVIEALCTRSSEVANIIAETNLRIERDASNSEAQKKVKLLKKEENVSTALHLFHATSDAIYPSHSIYTYNTILEALSNHGMAAEVLQVYEKMEISRIKPDVNTFVHLITAFGKHGDIRSAIECYNEYKTQAKDLIAHDENIVYEALITGYFACGDPTGGVEFLKKVQSVPGKYLSRRLLEAVVTGLCQRQDLDSAMQWVRQMKRNSAFPKPAISTVRPILLSASREGNLAMAKEAFEVVAHLRGSSGKEWKSEIQLFASLCLREGDLPTAVIVMDELILQKILPDSDIAASFLSAILMDSTAERALEYFERILHIAQNSPASEEIWSEVETIVNRFIKDFGIPNATAATRLIADLHLLPGILTQEASEISRTLIAPFKNLPENTVLDSITLAGLIKFQASLTGWDESKDDDVNYLISLLCAIRPDEWNCLSPARQVITDHFVRISDQDILGLWREMMTAVDLIDNPSISPITPTIESITSNYSPDDAVSVATLDTAMTSSMSAIPSTPPLRPLPAHYHYSAPRAPDFNITQSRRIIKSISRARGDPNFLNNVIDGIRYMRRKGERLLPETLGKVISLAGKAHRVDIVTEAFEFAHTTVQEVVPEHEVAFTEWCLILNSMIVAHAFNHNFEKARYYQGELMKLGVAPDSDAFAAYIVNLNVTDTNDEATEALSLFHKSKALGIRPSTFLYNTLISKLAKARRSDDALYYFHEMRVNGVEPSSVTFGTIINACCRVGNEVLAVKYFNEMENDGHFQPRIAPYNTMLQFYVQTKRDRSEALRFYEKMRAQILTPSAHTYKLLMEAYATLEPVDLKAAENILQLITKDGQRPTSVHYAALVHAYGCVKQDLQSAINWFYNAINPEFRNSVTPDETLYQALIEAYVANHNIAECGTIFKHMEENKVKLTVYMANHLIHGWTIAGNLEEARRVFDSLATDKNGLYGREPSSYEQMTRTYLAMGDRAGALSLVEEMKTKGYPAAVVARVTDILEGGEGFSAGIYLGGAAEAGSVSN
jgi:pentatricopeptide repeat protein